MVTEVFDDVQQCQQACVCVRTPLCRVCVHIYDLPACSCVCSKTDFPVFRCLLVHIVWNISIACSHVGVQSLADTLCLEHYHSGLVNGGSVRDLE